MFTLSLFFLAVAASEAAHAAGTVLNKNEFDALLLGQIIQIIAVITGIVVGWKSLRRNPPLTENIVRLEANQDSMEDRLSRVERRLEDGDHQFRENGKEDAAARATLDALKQDVHFIKGQVNTILGRLGGNHANH